MTIRTDDRALDAIADCISMLRRWAREAQTETADPAELAGQNRDGGAAALVQSSADTLYRQYRQNTRRHEE